MNTYTFETPEGVEIRVDLTEDLSEGSRIWEITIAPATGFEMFGRPNASRLFSGDANIEIITQRAEPVGDDRF